ncbi:MAG: allantoinase AllB [Chloroflexi bacterium]|nr:allantoinase AllB [Chloroflexota bacterium]
MKRVDLLIQGGAVVRSDSVFAANIAIAGGKIVALLAPELLPEATQVIDVTGKVVMAGLIDPHIHMRDPGKTEREDWTTGSKAAAAGGVTTLLDMPNTVPPVNCARNLLEKKEILSRKSLVDFGLYGGDGDTSIAHISEQVEAGAVALKTFLWPYPDRPDEFDGLTVTRDDDLLAILEAVAETGLVQALHPESKSIVDHYTRRLLAAGRRGPSVHSESRPVLAELEAVSRAILFAMETGVRLHIPHVSGGSVAALVRAAKDKGYRNITAETCPQYLFLTAERTQEIGPYAKVNPPLRSRDEQQRLWEYVLDGTIDTLGSDHAPNMPEAIEAGWQDIFAAPAGRAALETALPLLLTAANQGRIDLRQITKMASENTAKLYGLYPRKGVIQVGSDADLVVADMQKTAVVDRRKMYTKQKDAARMYDGWTVTGLPVMTIVRGAVVMRDGEILGQPGYGQFVHPLPSHPSG